MFFLTMWRPTASTKPLAETECKRMALLHMCQAPPLLVGIEREFARYLPVRLGIWAGSIFATLKA